MKLIAHRGWRRGAGENSLASFGRSAAEPVVTGVELDVRQSAPGRLVVSHDRPAPGEEPLDLDEALSFLGGTDLELFVELKEPGLGPAVLDRLRAHGLGGRSAVFAFPAAAASMPWQQSRCDVRLGVIVPYPWQVRSLIRSFRPDLILLGWDERAWTRAAFRVWWSAFSLATLGQRSAAAVVVGVARRPRDLEWLGRQGIEAAVADIDERLIGAMCHNVPPPQQLGKASPHR